MMGPIAIDRERCSRDGLCITECPLGVLIAGSDGVPEIRGGMESACINCGHCLAVCPSAALALAGVSPDACPPAAGAPPANWQTIEQIVKGRRSIRKYREESVPRETLERLLDMVRWAPTAVNRQPVYWTVVSGRPSVRRLSAMVVDWMQQQPSLSHYAASWEDGETRALRDAPHLVAAHGPGDSFGGGVDAVIATTTLELAASAVGLGACWAGFFMVAAKTHAPILEFLNLPEGHVVHGALMLGYPAPTYHRIPARDSAKVTWLE